VDDACHAENRSGNPATVNSMDAVYEKSDAVVFRRIADEGLLVPIRRTSNDVDCFYTLNETASRIWDLIDGRRSLEHIVTVVVEEFNVSPDDCRKDVLELICRFEHVRAIALMESKVGD
jgi:hypothetical protein